MRADPELHQDAGRMRLRDSFWTLRGPPETEAPGAVVERLRDAMQRALAEHLGPDGQELQRQVRRARDIDSLWYLRPEIMNAIAAGRGEAAARSCLVGLTALFRGHHPGATASRFRML